MDDIQQRRAAEKAAAATTAMGSAMLGSMGPIILYAIGGAFIAVIILILAAGLRGAWILAKAFMLYPLVILAAITALVFIWNFRRIRHGRKLIAIAAAVAIVFFGWKGTTSYYKNSNRVFASIYCGDYIQVLPDGSAPKLYEKRNQKGGASSLRVDEKVTVNGISFNEREFNITTADGKTGWVELAAFPEDAGEMLALSVGLDGVDAWEQTIDRQTERLMGHFYDIEEKGGGKDPKGYDILKYKEFTLKQSALNRFTMVGTQAPILYMTPKAVKKGEEWVDNGTKITLVGVAYEPDCTVIQLSVAPAEVGDRKQTPSRWVPYGGARNSGGWKGSLTVTDLDTGETWRMMPADYKKAWTLTGSGKERKETQLFFFPPFSSRRFSLTHGGVSPLPDGKTKSGYGGILGLLSSGTQMSGEASKFY